MVVGSLDICAMAYCIANGIGYSSSLNIFALVAGIFLYRGGVETARRVGFFSGFFLGAAVPFVLFSLFSTPFELILLKVKLEPGPSFLFCGSILVILGLIFWVYKSVTTMEILNEIKKTLGETSKFKTPKAGLLYGGGLALILGVVLGIASQGEFKAKAIEMARKQVGENYRFHVSGFSVRTYNGKSSYDVTVTAYNDKEIKDVPLHWDD